MRLDISIFPGQRTVHGVPYRRLGRFLKYRLVITGTLWKQNGPRETGNVVIGDLQFCYQKVRIYLQCGNRTVLLGGILSLKAYFHTLNLQLTTHCLYHIADSRIEESSKWSDSWSGERAFNGMSISESFNDHNYSPSVVDRWISNISRICKFSTGTTMMWASALQYLDSFTPQWITFEYPQPKTIKKFSFMGPNEKRWFGDGPT